MKNQLFSVMQIAGGTFPSGAFSQSWGLETYVHQKKVTDAESFKEFLDTFLISNIGKCEGPIVLKAYKLAMPFNEDGMMELESISNGIKATKESREASLRMGKAVMRIMEPILERSELTQLKQKIGAKGISYPVIYGMLCRYMEVLPREALESYVFSTVNALLQSAVKLIPLGNTEAQKILFDSNRIMKKTVECGIETSVENISNFCPGLDIAGIEHESLPVRLYMS